MPKRAEILSELQEELDDIALSGDMKEHSYLKLCKRMKRTHEQLENHSDDEKIQMFAEMCDIIPINAGIITGGLWPVDYKVMHAVFEKGKSNSDSWWRDIAETYVRFIMEDSVGCAGPTDVMEMFKCFLMMSPVKAHPFISYAVEKIGNSKIISICTEEFDDVNPMIKYYLKDCLFHCPHLIINMNAMRTHFQMCVRWKMLVTEARDAANIRYPSAWDDKRFTAVVGTRSQPVLEFFLDICHVHGWFDDCSDAPSDDDDSYMRDDDSSDVEEGEEGEEPSTPSAGGVLDVYQHLNCSRLRLTWNGIE